MKTYTKRVAFVVSHQTLIPHGGIGQFARSFVEMMTAINIKVDIICDKSPRDSEFVQEIQSMANIISPKNPVPYTDHSAIFMYEDSFCYERMANLRDALLQALEHNLYDAIVCNTYESVQVAHSLGLAESIQIIAYTHLESQIFADTKNPFLDEVNDLMRAQLKVNNLTVGTQSKHNAYLLTGAEHLPIPFTEKGLFEKYSGPREGVLFIGRWEEGKNPELFLKLIETTRLPARVMTNGNGAKKFEERLKKIGVPFQIKISITGQEKVNFIRESRLAFNPSTVESYGLAFLETMTQVPTVGLKDSRWLENFDERFYFTTTKKDMCKDVREWYDFYDTPESYYALGAMQYILVESAAASKWGKCINYFQPRKSNITTAKILEHTTIKYADFIQSLGRRIICIDDYRSVASNAHQFRVIYTDKDTWLTKDSAFVPVEEAVGASLFEGL